MWIPFVHNIRRYGDVSERFRDLSHLWRKFLKAGLDNLKDSFCFLNIRVVLELIYCRIVGAIDSYEEVRRMSWYLFV